MKNTLQSRKVVIVGAGAVGATFAYALAQDGTAEEIIILDANKDLAKGQALDLGHGLPFMPTARLATGTEKDYADADVIVITAGAKQQPGESRLNLLQRNAGIMRNICADISGQKSSAVVVVVSNPVDVLTHVAAEALQQTTGRVLGSGTVLDSARFRYLVGDHCGVDLRNVHAYILGEHGDSELPAWSMTHIAGMHIEDYCAVCGKCEGWQAVRDDIFAQVRDSAYHIIGYKGATCFAVGLALVRIVKAILRNERSVLTVSSLLRGQYGLDNVCLSVPCVVGSNGIERVIEARLNDTEQKALARSAGILSEMTASVLENE